MLGKRHFYNFFQQLLGETKGVYSSTSGAEIKRSFNIDNSAHIWCVAAIERLSSEDICKTAYLKGYLVLVGKHWRGEPGETIAIACKLITSSILIKCPTKSFLV